MNDDVDNDDDDDVLHDDEKPKLKPVSPIIHQAADQGVEKLVAKLTEITARIENKAAA